jgi:hypothetical protein
LSKITDAATRRSIKACPTQHCNRGSWSAVSLLVSWTQKKVWSFIVLF